MSVRDPSARGGRLRVLFFTSCLGGGGAEMNLLRLANHLDRARFSVGVAVARGGGSYESLLAPDVPLRVLTEGMARVPLAGRLAHRSTPTLVAAVPALRRLLARERPDVLCSVMDHANSAALLACAGLRGAPALALSVQISPVQEYLGPGKGPLARAIAGVIRRGYDRADLVVPLSRGVEAELLQMNPRLRGKTRLVHNAAIDERVRGARERRVARDGVPEGHALFVACGRLTAQKGFDVLLEALALARREAPCALWVLGEGPDRAALEARARSLGVDAHVQWKGFQRDPYAYMAAADAFVLSSRYEGFGNVLVEAMACGAPVVSTRCPHGPEEIVTDGVDGLLVPVNDPGALAAAMVRLAREPGLGARLAGRGSERAEDFAAPAVARAFGAALAEAAAGPHTRPAP